MKISIFQSEKGDCLLLESDDGKVILHDGGMRGSYQLHVAPALGRLRAAGRRLDLVYVSHIDQDHIAGVLQLADDLVAWRVYDHQRRLGNTLVKRPAAPRPPEISAIWHNAFHEQIGDNQGEIADMLAASANLLASARDPVLLEEAEHHSELALSQREAMQLSRRVSSAQLGIPLNPEYRGKLMYVRGAAPIRVGSLNIEVIGPFEADLAELRKKWNAWLADNRKSVEALQRRAAADEAAIGHNLPSLLRNLELAAEEFGNRKKVTLPNLASLMLYVEEPRPNGAPKRYLFTGDGHCDDIRDGLQRTGKLAAGGGLHVDVLKGQHHGSEHNWNEAFVKAITADHYLFCGNGEHENPDLGVVKMVLDSRVGPVKKRSPNPEAARPFKLWFSSSSRVPGRAEAQRHMAAVEALVEKARQKNPHVSFTFVERSRASFKV